MRAAITSGVSLVLLTTACTGRDEVELRAVTCPAPTPCTLPPCRLPKAEAQSLFCALGYEVFASDTQLFARAQHPMRVAYRGEMPVAVWDSGAAPHPGVCSADLPPDRSRRVERCSPNERATYVMLEAPSVPGATLDHRGKCVEVDRELWRCPAGNVEVDAGACRHAVELTGPGFFTVEVLPCPMGPIVRRTDGGRR